MHERHCLRKLEMYIDAGIECIITSGSGSITLQSPEKGWIKACEQQGKSDKNIWF